MAKKHKGRIRISHEFLLQRFDMPIETVITGVSHHQDYVEYYLEHPDLPEVVEGSQGPIVTPQWTVDFTWVKDETS